MYQDADARKDDLVALNEAQGPLFKIRNDPRRTKVGRIFHVPYRPGNCPNQKGKYKLHNVPDSRGYSITACF